MKKRIQTPKSKNKTIEFKSFSPSPQAPLMPICPNSLNKEDLKNNFLNSPNQLIFKKKRKIEWTKEEDENIREFVKKFGTKNWKKLSEIYPGKTPKQYREHYYNCLEDNIIKKKDFSPEEDLKIYSFVENYGHKFAKLSKLMPGRTETSIKNRYYYLSKNNFNPLFTNINKSTIENTLEPEIQNNTSLVDDNLFNIIDDNTTIFKDLIQTKIDQPIDNNIEDIKLDSDMQPFFNFFH